MWLAVLELPRPAAGGGSVKLHSHLMHDKHPAQSSIMPRLSEWAGGRASGRVEGYVSMGMLYMHMCANVYAASSDAPGGDKETVRCGNGGRNGWIVRVGERHLRFNLAHSLWARRGGAAAALDFPGVVILLAAAPKSW